MGEDLTGRVWADYLALNIGFNANSENVSVSNAVDVLNTKYYILTVDGYLYRVNFNGVDPFGFIVYSNNRGLVNNSLNASLYHSAIATNSSMTTLVGNIGIPLPQNGSTKLDLFHKIFFNVPSDDLPDYILTSPESPAKSSNFHFVGFTENIGYEKSGGYFVFNSTKTSSYHIIIEANNTKVLLGNTALKGENRIYWDGKDANGNYVEPGNYTATLMLKGGEYHFPMFDVESSKGISIELLNAPFTYEGFNPNIIYYNNSNYVLDGVNVDLSGKGITNPVNASINGVDSSMVPFAYGNKYGDFKIFDLWT